MAQTCRRHDSGEGTIGNTGRQVPFESGNMRRRVMPLVLWLLGVPLSVVIVLMLLGVV
jgi:hypothetical protein